MSEGRLSLVQVAWKGVSRKIFRNIVLVFAVGLLVGLLVFALLFKSAVEDDIDQATKRLGADIVIVPTKAKSMAEEFILESKSKIFYMDGSIYDELKDMDDIAASTYQIYLNTLDSGCCSIIEGQVIAFDQESDFVVTPWMDNPTLLKKDEVYVGHYVWEYLGLIETMNLFGSDIKMVDKLETTGTGIDHGIFMRLEDLDAITESALGDYKKGQISIIFIKVKEGRDIEAVVGRIRDINPRIGIMTRGNIGADVRSTLKDILRVFIITISISSLLAILLAWSTFSALANERRREVGILRALGARQAHIINLFLSEALIIALLGSIIGIFIGHYLINFLASDFHLLSQLDTSSGLTAHSVIISLVGMGAGIMVCLCGAALPVLRLAKLEPLRAIKEE
ncbi:MAG: FtsX-like permease family protein [Spirochaetales bacterium]|jgi:putative ABC transport system permease protein|nr:FtsX-like permease family protein [Spirochaetales bacterium]